MKTISILGSTGSIGTQTLDIVDNNRDIWVAGLAAGSNIDLLEQQIRKYKPRAAAVWEEKKAKELRQRLKDMQVEVYCGMEGLLAIATLAETDIVVTAIVGMIGIQPTIAAIRAKKNIALANK